MPFWIADHQPKPTRWVPTTTTGWRAFLTIRSSYLQWLIAVAVGLIVSLYLLLAISWRPQWAPFFALIALFPFVVMIVGDLKKLLLAVILLELPLQIDVYLLYDHSAVALGGIGGINVSLTTFCLAALYSLWLAEILAKRTSFPKLLRLYLPPLAYLAAVVISVVAARNVTLAAFEFSLLLQSFLLFLYIIKSVQSRQDVFFVVTLLMIGLFLESLVIIGLRLIGHSISFARIQAGIDAGGRVAGTIGSPNTAASYLTLLLAPALGLMLTPLGRRYKWLAILAFSLGSAALVLTLSRGGWIAFIVSVTLFCLFALYQGWLKPRILLSITVVALAILLLFRQPILARLFGDDAGSASNRVTLMKLALRIIEDHPLLGVGANNSGLIMRDYITPEISGAWFYAVHNKYLLVWAETGIVGLFTFLLFLLSVIHRGLQGYKARDRLLSPLALGFTVAIIGQMTHMLFDVFNSRPQVQLFWLLAGLITAMGNIVAKEHYRGN